MHLAEWGFPGALTLTENVSMNIYNFKPTTLYIKRHSVTGKLYFGKTTKNVLNYNGSGKRWLYHIRKYGKNHVETLWYETFLDKDDLIAYALKFSADNNIVESTDWLNLIPENGLDGAMPGGVLSIKHKRKIKIWMETNAPFRGRTHDQQAKNANRQKHLNKIPSIESRNKMSVAQKRILSGTPSMLSITHVKGKTSITDGKDNKLINMTLEEIPSGWKVGRTVSKKVCRICDRKEMDQGNYNKWDKSLTSIPLSIS